MRPSLSAGPGAPDFYSKYHLPSPTPSGDLPLMVEDDPYDQTADSYQGGLGDFWSDLVTTAETAVNAKSAQKRATAAAAQAAAEAQTRALMTSRGSVASSSFLGMPMTTWLLVAGAGIGGYLLLSRRKR